MGKIFPWLINFACLGFLFGKIARMDNPQGALFFLYFFPVLLLLNVAVWLILKIFGNPLAPYFRNTSLFLLLMSWPLYYLAGHHGG